jgi:DNA-binding transcriptional regulator GbsR (MarR family)
MDDSEQIRRDFAAGWGKIGAAWGVAPSTATVQGYLLLHGGPLTEAEVRDALGLSHKAAFTALSECESWGLVEQVEPKRTGKRGPPGRAWMPVGDHWEWFRRVAAARKERETDPLLPLLDECLRRIKTVGDEGLHRRVASLLSFTHQFDRGVGAVVRTDAMTIAHLFGVLDRVDDATLERLSTSLAAIPEQELAAATTSLAKMRPQLLRRLVGVAGQRGIARLLRSI